MQINKRRLRIMLLLAVSLAILYFLWLVRAVLYPFLIAFAIAYVLHPALCVLTKRGTPRVLAIFMVFAALGGIVGLIGIFLTPVLLRELTEFAARVPEFTARAQMLGTQLQSDYTSVVWPDTVRPVVDEAVMELEQGLQQFVRGIFNGMLGLMTHMIGLLISPILAFYMLNDWEAIGDKLQEVIPMAWRREFLCVVQEIDAVLTGVIRGQLTVGLLVMILVSAGLYIIGLDFAVLIGIFAGLLDVVPYFGAIAGALPAVLLALLYSPAVVVKVVLLFFIVHQLEGSVLSPKILGDNVGLHPLMVVFVLLVGGELYGLLGLLLAVPVAAVLKVLAAHALEWLVEH